MDFPDKKYSVIYADPPWSYRQCGTGPKSRGNAAQHYHTMTTDDICALPVNDLAGGGARPASCGPRFHKLPMLCELWRRGVLSTRPAPLFGSRKTARAIQIFGAWGLTRGQMRKSVCLGVTPGFKAADRVKSHAVHQVIETPIQEHSAKPDETRKRIVELLGDVPRIELFARKRTPGWDAWGDELE